MDRELIKLHNDTVKPDDIVYHLGDFSLNKRAPELILPQLNGTHFLIPGNHDWVHTTNHKNKPGKAEKFREIYEKAGFKILTLIETMQINGLEILLSHMPYCGGGDHTGEERYTQYRPVDEGKVLLHGHVHESWKIKDRMFNVGVDVSNFRPVPISAIEDFVITTNGVKPLPLGMGI